jgi:hypothetical protein
MNARITVIPGQHFDGGVVDAIPSTAPADAPKRELVDPYTALLSNLFTEHQFEDPSIKQTCANLLMRRVELNKECDVFLGKLRVSLRERLIEQHEESKKAVRDQQKKIDALAKRTGQAQAELNTKKDDTAKAMSVFHGATQDRAALGRYASRKTIAAADAAVHKAEQSVDRANAAQTDLQQEINQMIFAERKPLQDELSRLMAEELEMASALSGQSYTDSLGIVHRPRAPL